MPAMGGCTGEFDPRVVVRRRRSYSGQVAAGAFLIKSYHMLMSLSCEVCVAYMLLFVGTLVQVLLGGFGEFRIPDEVLRAVKSAPVPMSPHDSTNEGGVIVVRSGVVLEIALLDLVRRCSNRRDRSKSDEEGGDLHVICRQRMRCLVDR